MENAVSRVYLGKSLPIAPTIKVHEGGRSVRVLISTEHRDRDGDVVRQRGMSTKNYVRNGAPVFWGHESRGLPIARSLKLKREKLADGVWGTWADPEFAVDIADYSLPRVVRDLVMAGFVVPSSIGFVPEPGGLHDLPDGVLTELELETRGNGGMVRGYDIRASELLEWSFVGIPANPNVDIQAAMDVARRHMKGAALDGFRRSLIGEEPIICIGCTPIEKAPEHVRALVGEPIVGEIEDYGFDLLDHKLAELGFEPAQAAGGEPVAKTRPVARCKQCGTYNETDPEEGHENCWKCGEPVPVAGGEQQRIEALEKELARVDEARRMLGEECEAWKAKALKEQHLVTFSFSAEMVKLLDERFALIDARLVKTERAVEDALVDVWGRKEDELARATTKQPKACGCGKAAPASRDAAGDPAPVAKDASPPALSVEKSLEAAERGMHRAVDKFLGIVR